MAAAARRVKLRYPATTGVTIVDPERVLEHRVRARRLKARLFGIDEPPVHVGRYRVEAVIGAGAMGVVYAARDDRLDRRVAVKVLRPELARGAARLEREARALARLSHPNVVTVHEVGESDGSTFLVMEHVDGRSLRAWLGTPRTLAARFDVLLQAAAGLAAAHRLGVVHRDFKPDNAIVGDDGRVRIVDFGLATAGDDAPTEVDVDDAARGASNDAAMNDASTNDAATSDAGAATPTLHGRITQTGQLVGTPAYLAPELLAGAPPSPRSDQFAFACVAWEVLFGRHPYAPGERRDRVPVVPTSPRLDGRVVAAIVRGLDPDPQARHDDLTVFARRLAPSHGRTRMLAIAAAALVLGVVLTVLALGDRTREASPPASDEPVAEPRLVRAPACSEAPSFEQPRARLERSLQMYEELLRATEPSGDPVELAAVLEPIAEIELALGQRLAACRRLERILTHQPAREPAACWHASYCDVTATLPDRASCFAGELWACRGVAIKHEYELLEASAAARAGTDDQAEVLRAAHLELFVDVLARGCELGDAQLCEQLARHDPFTAASSPRTKPSNAAADQPMSKE